MKPLSFVVDLFVNTFGITRPTPGEETRAGRYIALMLLAVLLFLVGGTLLVYRAFTH